MSFEAIRWALSCRGVSPRAKVTLFHLANHCNSKTKSSHCWPSSAALQEETELSRSSLYLAIEELCKQGLVVRESGGGRRTTKYHLQFDPEQPGTSPANDCRGEGEQSRIRDDEQSRNQDSSSPESGTGEVPKSERVPSRIRTPEPGIEPGIPLGEEKNAGALVFPISANPITWETFISSSATPGQAKWTFRQFAAHHADNEYTVETWEKEWRSWLRGSGYLAFH